MLSEEHSCRQAVTHFASFLIAQGKRPCSTITSSYCRARKRLSEIFLSEAVMKSARWIENETKCFWWHGRSVKLVDGYTLGMADTHANQRAYPQIEKQTPGLGYPIARICCVFSLATGAVIGAAIGPYQGKGSGETSLFRTLFSTLQAGDIVVGDRYYCSYWVIALLGLLKVDFVFRLHSLRKIGTRKKLGKNDWLIQWQRQKYAGEVEWETYQHFAPRISLRLIKINVSQKGYRTRKLYIVTSLLDPNLFCSSQLGELYGLRWSVEGDIRAVKHSMQMDFLRCRTPEMVRKEIWVHLLSYNLVRIFIAQAAGLKGILPRSISFTAALAAFRSAEVFVLFSSVNRNKVRKALLCSLLLHRVANRPGRSEPREIKLRRRRYNYLKKPRKKVAANAMRN